MLHAARYLDPCRRTADTARKHELAASQVQRAWLEWQGPSHTEAPLFPRSTWPGRCSEPVVVSGERHDFAR